MICRKMIEKLCHVERGAENSETYAATRLIKVQRSPRRILAFKSDDMVLEKLEPMEKRNRRRRNCKMNKSVMSQNGFCVGAIRTVPHSQV